MAGKYRISSLSLLAARAFQELKIGQNSARIREVPDVRTIRYYTTLGLVDRPSVMQGRTGFYENKHLLQLIAIKRLQSAGLTLVEIQQTLATANERQLKKIADLPGDFFDRVAQWVQNETPGVRRQESKPAVQPKTDSSLSVSASASRGDEPFWAAGPATPETASNVILRSRPDSVSELPIDITQTLVLRIADGVSLHLDGVDVSRFDTATMSLLQPAIKELRSTLMSVGLTTNSDSSHRPPEPPHDS